MDASINKRSPTKLQCQSQNDGSMLSVDSMINSSTVSANGNKTPMKSFNCPAGQSTFKTPNKTPKKTPGTTTPKRSSSKTPMSGGDRFIPCRNAVQFNLAHHLLTRPNDTETQASISPSQREYQKLMAENLSGMNSNSKIITYAQKAPAVPEGYQNELKVLYSSQNKTRNSGRKTMRNIPQMPERILDAPEILDDYYLNLLDWSHNNQLAVCLAGHVYLWNASTGSITELLEMDNSNDYISSVAWVADGHCLAVGTSNGSVQLWDVQHEKRMRIMTGHASRVSALSWNNHILSSGSRSGAIHHHDVREANHQVGSVSAHSQEICGLRWSPDGRYLASGANDNVLHVWSDQVTSSEPRHTFTAHQAAVKALAWCPWQPGLLASGGGTADRQICFWNCNTGALLNSVDTKSQVCALIWSSHYHELISGHGFAQNQLTIWKYPTMSKVANLTGHTSRILHMALSPDGTTVVSAAADETLRLWKCFQIDPEKAKPATKNTSSILRKSIR